MDLFANLAFLVLFGMIGFVTSKVIGINLYRIFSDLAEILFIGTLFFFTLQAASNPAGVSDTISQVVSFFVGNLPGIIIGDIAGSIIAAVTGEPP